MNNKYLGLVTIGGLLLVASPSEAVTIDLTGATTQGTVNGGVFIRTDAASTGTGVISSFVRVQDPNSPAEGYNATARPVMTDVNTSPEFTHDIQLSAVPLVTNPDGLTGQYYEFLLDINQTAANPFLSLDSIQIYTRATALTEADDLADLTAAPSVLRYNLDGAPAGDSEILLNYSLNTGSGSGDLFAYIPLSAFPGALSTDFVYLYSMFGAKGGVYAENDGFEEWAVRTPGTTQVPDGGSAVALLGMTLIGIEGLRRKLGTVLG